MTLVWDFSRGDVIDAETGEVVDRIYVPEIVKYPEGPASAFNGSKVKPVGLRPETKAWLKLLNTKKRIPRLSRARIRFDGDGVINEEGWQVKVFEIPLPSKPDELVTRVVNEVLPKYPKLNSRTTRAKYAIAAILVAEAVYPNKRMRVKDLVEQFGVSREHVRRLVKLVNSLPYKEEILNQVKEVLA